MKLFVSAFLTASLAGALSAPLAAQSIPTVIFTSDSTVANSAIPGTSGAIFERFDRLSMSPGGTQWTLVSSSTASNSFDNHFLVNGQLVVREFFDTLPWNSSAGWVGGSAAISDVGEIALAAEGSGGTREFATFNPSGMGAWTLRESNGGPVPGLAGRTWLNFQKPVIAADGRFGGVANVTGSGAQEVAFFDGAVVAESGVTQLTGASADPTLLAINNNSMEISADGSTISYTGFTTPGDVVVVNGEAVLEKGEPVSGIGSTRDILRITGKSMDSTGRTHAWGFNESDGWDWVWRDGQILAQEFDPIVPGSSEIWRKTSTLLPGFHHATSHPDGDYLVVGETSAGGGHVIVRNGTDVVLRVGDPIDLDGNGLLDDNATFGSVDLLAGWGANDRLLMVATIQSPGTGFTGKAVIEMTVDSPGGSLGTTYCTSTPNSTGSDARMILTGSASLAADDLVIEVVDLPPNQFGMFVCSRTQGQVQGPGGSQGTLCLGGGIGRLVGGGIVNSGAQGRSTTPANLTALPTPTQTVSAQVGETWNFQLWFRDVNPGATSNYSSAMSITIE